MQRRRRVAALSVLGVLLLAIFVATVRTSAIPDDVAIAGVDVSGMTYEQARSALTPTVDARLATTMTFVSSDDPTLTIDIPASTVSSGADFDTAFEHARSSRGRFGRLLSRFGIAGHREIPLTFRINGSAVNTIVDRANGNLGADAVSAAVIKNVAQFVVRPAKEGRSVDRNLLVRRMSTLPARVEVPVRVEQPPITTAAAERARDLAERLRTIARTITYRDRTTTLQAATVTRALTFTPRGSEILVELEPAVLRRTLSKPLGIIERAPQNARWKLAGQKAILVPSQPGNQLDAAALASAIRTDPTQTTLVARVSTDQPDRTTAEARKLKITELISTFTTPFDPGQNRVINIARGARILDSTLLMPGERFSLNDHLGERTVARGFVEAPAIEGGELKPTIGGGVSQVATTIYNAAFFGGLEIISATPHSFWFPRYPKGREATVSWREPDLVFRNNWDAAVLIAVDTTNTSLTVRMYSSKLGRRVETTTGEPTNIVKTKTIERLKPEMEPGSKKIVQAEGQPGFTISYTRKVYRGDELISNRTFWWTYKPENEIVEMGPPKPDEPTGTTTGTTTTGTTPTGTTTTPTGTTTAPTGTTTKR